MSDDESDEQARHNSLCESVNTALLGARYRHGLEALAAVAARLCAEQESPGEEGFHFLAEFMAYVDDELGDITVDFGGSQDQKN